MSKVAERLMLCREIGQMLPKDYPLFFDDMNGVLYVVGYKNEYGTEFVDVLPDYVLSNAEELYMELQALDSNEMHEVNHYRMIRF